MTRLALYCATLLAMTSPALTQAPVNDVFKEAQRRSEAVDHALLAQKEVRNVGTWAVVIWRILVSEPWVTLRVIEDKLRRLDIDVYLVANPADAPGAPRDTCARLPYDEADHCRPFALWIGINGQVEARARMNTFGADEAQNLAHLGQAGVMILKRRDPP